jgi:hypothetical protein
MPEAVSIDVNTEALLSVDQARQHPALGPCHVATIHRLFTKGAKATNGSYVRLAFVQTPSGRKTSREAIASFILALTNADGNAPKMTSTAEKKRRERVRAELEREGIR